MKRYICLLLICLALVACSRKEPVPTGSPPPTSEASPTPMPSATAAGSPVPRITIVPSATPLPARSQGAAEESTASPSPAAESLLTPTPSSTATPRVFDAGATATIPPTATLPDSPLPESPLPTPSRITASPTPTGSGTAPSGATSTAPAETAGATHTPGATTPANASPSPTRTGTPEPEGEAWRFEKVFTYYEEEFAAVFISGEVTNASGSFQRISSLIPVILDRNGKPVTSQADVDFPAGYDQLRSLVSLAPGQSLAFFCWIDLPTGVSFAGNYEIRVEMVPTEPARDDVDITRDDYDRSDWPDVFYVEGTFDNPGPDLTRFVAIVATVYDDDGHVIGVGWMYETASFYLKAGKHEFAVEVEIWELVDYLGLEVYSYKVQAFGN